MSTSYVSTTCPTCGMELRCIGTDDHPAQPVHDDAAVCLRCGGIGVWSGEQQCWTLPTPEKRAELLTDTQVVALLTYSTELATMRHDDRTHLATVVGTGIAALLGRYDASDPHADVVAAAATPLFTDTDGAHWNIGELSVALAYTLVEDHGYHRHHPVPPHEIDPPHEEHS